MGKRVPVVVLFLWVGMVSTCDSPSNRAPVRAQPPQAEAAPSLFSPVAVQLPGDSAARPLLEMAAAERLAAAEVLLAGDETENAEVMWLAARAAEDTDNPVRALALWEQLQASRHALSNWAGYRRAQLLSSEDPAAAAAVASTLIEEDWAGKQRARVMHASALAHAGDGPTATPLLTELLSEAGEDSAAAEIALPLAMILSRSEDAGDRENALGLYRRVAARALGRSIVENAQRRATEVLATLPRERRVDLSRESADESYERADTLYRAMQHRDAENAFAETAAHPSADEEMRCRARLMQGKAMLRRRERDQGARHMESVAADCTDTDIRAWALYHAARSHAQRGRNTQALARYDELVEAAPAHRLTDDALYRGSLSADATGDPDGATERLTRLADNYPEGDMRGDARFRLAWQSRELGLAATDAAEKQTHFASALRQLEASIHEGSGEDAEDIHGRARYWRARILEEMNAGPEVVSAYTRLINEWPMAYYSQRALSRLDALSPDDAAGIRAAFRQDLEELEELTFPLRPEMSTQSFENAVRLLQLGESTWAQSEFRHVGLLGHGSDQEGMWLVAACLDTAGEHPAASRLVRGHLGSFLRTVPTGRDYHYWRIAYPDAFSPLIERAAEGAGVPAAFVRSIAREESAFNPNAVSVAHAYGLIQLIRPTAQRFARELGLPSTPADLRNPETNLRIGSAFISFLWRHYETNPSIVPSAYNAGEGAVDRWLSERSDLPLDAFVETIPYDETRRYTRRVLQTFGTYSWLDGGNLPPIRATTLPASRR